MMHMRRLLSDSGVMSARALAQTKSKQIEKINRRKVVWQCKSLDDKRLTWSHSPFF